LKYFSAVVAAVGISPRTAVGSSQLAASGHSFVVRFHEKCFVIIVMSDYIKSFRSDRHLGSLMMIIIMELTS